MSNLGIPRRNEELVYSGMATGSKPRMWETHQHGHGTDFCHFGLEDHRNQHQFYPWTPESGFPLVTAENWDFG